MWYAGLIGIYPKIQQKDNLYVKLFPLNLNLVTSFFINYLCLVTEIFFIYFINKERFLWATKSHQFNIIYDKSVNGL